MNLGQLIAEVQGIVGEHPEIDHVKMLNKGVEKLALLSKKITTTSLAVTNGVATLPTDCLIVRGVSYEDSPLERYAGNISPDYSGTTPLYWSKSGSSLSLIPAISGANITVAYTSKGDDMVDEEDSPEVEGADDFLIAYCCYRILLQSEGLTELTKQWNKEQEDEKADWVKLDADSERRPYIGKRPTYR